MRVRIRFAKVGRVRWTSHRDVARMWERALRRAGLPVSYTGGFSPRPQLSFGLALPTGCESVAEYLDAAFDAEVHPSSLADRLNPLLPDGVTLDAAAEVERGTPSLQEAVTSCSWEIEVAPSGAEEAVARALAASDLPVDRERKGRRQTEDLRPSILHLELLLTDGAPGRLRAELATQPRGVRPSELAQAVGLQIGLARRTCQWIERSGSRWEPLAVSALSPEPALESAS